jgi:4-hydroxy-tetrahydrodipicolinate synthase
MLPEGVYVAAITPRRTNACEIDLAAALELIDYLGGTGAKGIALLGSTGEFTHFDLGERARLIAFAAKRSRIPIIAGVGHSTLDGALALAREASSAGVAAVLLMPPYFFPYRQAEIEEFYLQFAAELDGAAPILLYNIPAFTSPIECETAIRLLSTGRFAGIKDSSGDFESFLRLKPVCAERNLTLLAGHDSIFTRARMAGAAGIISGVACAVPELLLALDSAICSGSSEKRERLNARLQEFINWIERFPPPAAINEAVRLRGFKAGRPAVPLDQSARQQMAEFGNWFQAWLPVVRKEADSEG